MKDSPWLLEFLELIRKKPGMYLGENRVERLEAYILGYRQARIDFGLPEFHESEESILEGFTYWLAVKLKSTMSLNWAGFISHELDPSQDNIYTFYKYFDQFMLERKRKTLEQLKFEYDVLFNRIT